MSDDIQAAVDEIRAVCERRGMVLIGTCISEGIYGEILVAPESNISWRQPNELKFNEIYQLTHFGGDDSWYVAAIGRQPT